jgi:hypothetical protein
VVGETRYVRASSLSSILRGRESRIAAVRSYLEDCAGEQRTTHYEPVMNLIGLTHSKPADREAIGGVLGAILDQTWREHGVALTVIVRRNAAGRSRCGPGFFKLVASLAGLPDWNDEAALVERETERVWKFYAKPLGHEGE